MPPRAQLVFLFLFLAPPSVQSWNRQSSSWSNCSLTQDYEDVIFDCTGKGLSTIPRNLPSNATVLILRRNSITSIPANIFGKMTKLRLLDISNNNKTISLDHNSLRGLVNLRTLTLQNVAGLSLGCGESRPFRHVPFLENLNLKDTDNFDSDCLNNALYDLSNLRTFAVPWPVSPLPDNFSFLKSLDVLDLSRSTLNLTFDTFKALSNLSVSRLSLQKVDVPLFSDMNTLDPVLPTLRVLDLTCTAFPAKTNIFSPFITSLQNSSLHTLILDKVHSGDGVNPVVSAEQFQPLKNVPLKALSLRQNSITTYNPFLRYLRHLEYLNLDYNVFIPTPLTHDQGFKLFIDVLLTKHLKEVSISNMNWHIRDIYLCDQQNPLFHGNFGNDEEGKTSFNLHSLHGNSGFVIKGYLSVEVLHLSNIGVMFYDTKKLFINVSDIIVGQHTKSARYQLTNYVRFLNLSHNFIGRIETVFYGLDSLRIVDISHNKLEHVHSLLFRNILKLEKLFISNNRIGLFTSPEELATTFSHLSAIELIDLSANQLTTVTSGMFENCLRLHTVLLQRNNIAVVDATFKKLPFIKLMDLGHNYIKKFSFEQVEDLKKSNLTLRLTGNLGFECSCKTVDFITWIQAPGTSSNVIENKKDLKCASPDGTHQRVVEVSLQGLGLYCVQNALIISSAVVSAMGISVAVVIWRHKWTIKYWMYLLKLRRRGIQVRDRIRPRHAYISATDDDLEKANMIFQQIEDKLGENSVFWKHRDTVPGRSTFDEIFRGVEESRKVILCITQSYSTCTDQNFEVEMSFARGKGFIIPVLIGDVPLERLPRPLRRLLRDDIYLEWPNNVAEMPNFWVSLHEAVMTQKGVIIRKNGNVFFYGD